MKPGKNASYVRFRISTRVFRRLIQAFALDLSAAPATPRPLAAFGTVLGAIGVSGSVVESDHVVAAAAVK